MEEPYPSGHPSGARHRIYLPQELAIIIKSYYGETRLIDTLKKICGEPNGSGAILASYVLTAGLSGNNSVFIPFDPDKRLTGCRVVERGEELKYIFFFSDEDVFCVVLELKSDVERIVFRPCSRFEIDELAMRHAVELRF